MKYREKRRTADFIHELIHDPVHIGGEYVGKMAFRAVERLVPGDHILNIALCKGADRDDVVGVGELVADHDHGVQDGLLILVA